MRQLTAAATAILTFLLLALSPATMGWADSTDPVVEDEGNGGFTGSHGLGNQPVSGGDRQGGGKSGAGSPDVESEDPGPVTNCDRGSDGELLTPWDCPVEPVDVLDRATAEALARRIVVRLQLPKPTPHFGPDPSVNEWKIAAVGYPLWLWTEGPRTVSSSESAYGLTFTLTARYRSTTFDMGDGSTVRCTKTTVYRRSTPPGTKSPTCGYAYLEAARGDGTYTVTATTHWDIDWSVAGFSGTLPGTHRASRELPVGELQAIVVK